MDTAERYAQVYVFALLAHTNKLTANPLDLGQWVFYVIPTAVLDRRTRSQRSITLKTLEELTTAIGFGDLREAVSALSAHTATGDNGKGHQPAQTAAPKAKAAAESPKSAARKSSALQASADGPGRLPAQIRQPPDQRRDGHGAAWLRRHPAGRTAGEAKARNLHTAAGQQELLDLIGWATTIKSAQSKVRAALVALASESAIRRH